MDSSRGQHQEMATQSLESMLVCSKAQEDQRKPWPQPPEEALKCPRCDSTNTKFCYYNNYSLTQPRYFCKSCRRYWTKGGTLRNVPVGGGCRKNKRSSSSSNRSQDQPLIISNTNPLTNFPPLSYDSNDHLSLVFSRLHKQNGGHLGFDDQHDFSILGNPTTTSTHYDNFQNLYHGFGNGTNMGEAVHHHHHHHHHDHNHDHGVSAEMLMPFRDHHHQMSATANATATAVTVTTVKEELVSNSREMESNKVSWGFPWKLINNADAGINNELNSTWHGLINDPLT